jgi:spore coat polysaccharide biosynthesis protein SpsF
MLRNLGVIQFPWETSRLKGCFRRRLGGKTLVEWVARRMTDCQRLDGVILLVGDSDVDHEVAELAPPDVPVFVSRHADPLARFIAALDEYNPEAVVRVSATTPFVDPSLVDRLVSAADAHPECDYISYCSRDGQPVVLSPICVYAEWIKAKALRRAARRATDPADRQGVTRYIY